MASLLPRIPIRAPQSSIDAWKAAAARVGLSLNAWVEITLDRACGPTGKRAGLEGLFGASGDAERPARANVPPSGLPRPDKQLHRPARKQPQVHQPSGKRSFRPDPR